MNLKSIIEIASHRYDKGYDPNIKCFIGLALTHEEYTIFKKELDNYDTLVEKAWMYDDLKN